MWSINPLKFQYTKSSWWDSSLISLWVGVVYFHFGVMDKFVTEDFFHPKKSDVLRVQMSRFHDSWGRNPQNSHVRVWWILLGGSKTYTSLVVEPRKVPKVFFLGGWKFNTISTQAEKMYWILLQSAISKCKQLCMEFLCWPICIDWKGNSFWRRSVRFTPPKMEHMSSKFQVETKLCPVFDSSSRCWFQIFFMFTSTWGNDPIWRAYVFRWVGSTTNQIFFHHANWDWIRWRLIAVPAYGMTWQYIPLPATTVLGGAWGRIYYLQLVAKLWFHYYQHLSEKRTR